MKNNSGPEGKFSKGSGPAFIGSLSEPAIRRRLLSDAVQHPSTLLPLAVVTASGIYLLLLSPVLGGGFWSIGMLVVCSVVAAASFVWHYIFRYTEGYAERVRELMDLQDRAREREKQAQMSRLCESLQAEFTSNDSTEGLKVLSGLVGGYEQLQPSLCLPMDTGSLAMAHVPSLAEETYQRGLSVLSDALDLMKVTQAPGRGRLEREVEELGKEVETLKEDDSQVERLRIKEGILGSHRQRLDMLDQLQVRVDQLLYQAGRCEASLHRARLELAALKAGNAEASVSMVIETLRMTINRAKEVQDELKRLGF